MNCASCGQTNPTGARFCGGCGASLAPRCAACGTESPAGARFCNGCGAALVAPLARPAADAVSRKIVTIVFADLIGSVSLHERLDAESARRLMDRYHRAMSAAVDVHGGGVVQLLGDGVLAAFGVPRVAEDDAIRAVRAAVGMQRAFRELVREQGAAMQNVGLRVAVNTGEIVVADDVNSVMGDPTNVAARLQQEARDGDVIVGEGTQRLVRDLVTLAPLGTFALRGRTETVAAYRVVSLDRPASQQSIAFVGRDDEIRRLVAVYDAAVAAPAPRLAVLLGSPGLGKSRLVAEFTRRVGERATVLSARCDADGGATFAPLAEALRALLRIEEGAGGDVLRAAVDAVVSGDDTERTRIAEGIGALLAGEPAPPEETFFVVRRLLAALATVRPVVLVIDDLQWAEPLLLDLVEHLVQWSTDVPLLVLVAARPELRDARSSLATPGGVVTEVVALSGLDAGAATRLAANVIGGSELPAALAGRVLATSEGNPLFVTELVRMLVQDGVLVRDGDRWITTVEVSKLDMPATIQVLLAARIERLRPEERSVLERAAVIGRQFSRAAVAQLLPRDAADLDARLEALRRSELIEPDTGWFLGEPALRFHHVLIRDAAYRRILKETRAELHERLADWIVARVGDAIEHDETIGWHLEQAHQHLRELGLLDPNARNLGERAARHLGAAGRRALACDDLALAAGLLERALDRLDPEDAARADLALDWCEALLAAGDVGPAAAAIDELGRFTAHSERLRAWHTCFAGQLAALTDPQSLRATADAVAGAAAALAAASDAAGEAKAHFVHAIALSRLGEIGACETALDLALAAARRARDRRRANAVLAGAPVAALWGPSPVTRASGRCLDVVRVLRITQGAPAVEAVALRCQAVLETLRGRGGAARRMIASSRRMVEELGIAQQLLEADVFAGHIELLEGDADAAERFLRSAYDGLCERGLGIDAARAAALLGRALLAQDRAAEAEALSHESEALAGDDLKAAIAWRGVRAEALARRGESATSVELARAAVGIAAATDALLDHADARQALAAALRAAGRNADADAEESRAIGLWEAKGATLLLERTQRAGGRGAREDRAPVEVRTGQRRVRPNAATENTLRFNAAIAARDASALPSLWAADAEIIHHPTGATFGRDAAVASMRSALEMATGLALERLTLATLGDSLTLCRLRASATAVVSDDYPLGAIELDQALVIEVNERCEMTRTEIFARDHLAAAVARFYERHAEQLPAGPERERAAATAQSVARWLQTFTDLESFVAAIAPEFEFVDHRPVGMNRARGVESFRRAHRAQLELARDIAFRIDDVAALSPDAFLLRSTTSGIDRASGGAYDRPLLLLGVFGKGGLVTRIEWFDPEQDDAALARFDELTAPQPPKRRVRSNAATAVLDRQTAAHAARDLTAFAQLCAEDITIVHHPTRVEFGRDAGLSRFESLYRAEDLVIVNELLATFGDSLALSRTSTSASALADYDIEFGAVRIDTHVLTEANARGQLRRVEVFADDHLADAIARLYERHAEVLPEGPERSRAAMAARAVAAVLPTDCDAIAAVLTPDVEFADRRTLGMGSGRGAERYLRGLRSLFDVARDRIANTDELIAAKSDALLVRRTTGGIAREGGGAFEHHFLMLWVFGADGRLTHIELFDADRGAAALARFDALTIEPPERRFANAASRCVDRSQRCWAERDFDAVLDCHASTCVMDDRRAMVRLELTSEQFFANQRVLFEVPWLRFRAELLATRGERLALLRVRFGGEAPDGGEIHVDHLSIVEVDEAGRSVALVVFDPDARDAANAELWRRYLAGEGRPHAALFGWMREFGRISFERDWDALARFLPDDFNHLSHRRFAGTGARMDRDEYLRTRGSMEDLQLRGDTRIDHVLRIGAQAAVFSMTWFGTLDGGAFENPFLAVIAHDGRRMHANEMFDDEQIDAALARFEELSREPAAPARIENVATRAAERLRVAFEALDFDAFSVLLSPQYRNVDRQKTAQLESDRAPYLEAARAMLASFTSSTVTIETLATRGERFALGHIHWKAVGETVGAVEFEWLSIIEVDGDGRLATQVDFDPGDLDAAYAELDACYAAGEAVAFGPVAAAMRAFASAFSSRDWDALASLCASDLVVADHRRLGWETLHGPAVYVGALRALVDLAPDTKMRLDHVTMAEHGFLVVTAWSGTRDGGAFEAPSGMVGELDGAGRVRRLDQYDLERFDQGRARFEALRGDPA